MTKRQQTRLQAAAPGIPWVTLAQIILQVLLAIFGGKDPTAATKAALKAHNQTLSAADVDKLAKAIAGEMQ